MHPAHERYLRAIDSDVSRSQAPLGNARCQAPLGGFIPMVGFAARLLAAAPASQDPKNRSKRSFGSQRSQAELGNEEERGGTRRNEEERGGTRRNEEERGGTTTIHSPIARRSLALPVPGRLSPQ